MGTHPLTRSALRTRRLFLQPLPSAGPDSAPAPTCATPAMPDANPQGKCVSAAILTSLERADNTRANARTHPRRTHIAVVAGPTRARDLDWTDLKGTRKRTATIQLRASLPLADDECALWHMARHSRHQQRGRGPRPRPGLRRPWRYASGMRARVRCVLCCMPGRVLSVESVKRRTQSPSTPHPSPTPNTQHPRTDPTREASRGVACLAN